MNSQKGFILITALIFLTIVSLFALHALEAISLQQKISHTWSQYQQLLSSAEQDLKTGEKTLDSQCTESNHCIKVTKVASLECIEHEKLITITFYQITASESRNNLTVALESTYTVSSAPDATCDDIKPGRQSWRQLSIDMD